MKWLSAALAFAFASVIAATLLAFLFSGLKVSVAWLAFACGIVAASAAWRATESPARARLGCGDWLVLAFFALCSLRAFLWLIYARDDEICVLSPNNLGDLSLHLNLIRYMASGVPFWPDSSILSRAPLSYPLGADLFTSLLELCGVTTARGLIWTGLAGAGLTGCALWFWGGPFGIAAFLFNGGLAGFAVLRTLQIEDFQREMVWKNLFLSMFVTQRGLLFALPAGLLLLHTWRERYFRTGHRVIPAWLQLLLYASMPLFNIHAFLFLSIVLLSLFITCRAGTAEPFPHRAEGHGVSTAAAPAGISVPSPGNPGSEILVFVAWAVIPATFWIFAVTGFFSASSGFRWFPSWMAGETGWSAWTWAGNFGLVLPLSLALAISLVFDRDPEARCFVWTAAAIFVACCLVVVAPWEWDNMKVILWSWLVAAPYLWTRMIVPLRVPARVCVCGLLFFSGGVSLIGGLDGRHGYAIARRSELAAWQHAIADIPPEDRFACVSDYNHPLILLGRKVACGYEGHLWSHGLNYRAKLDLLNRSLSGEVDWRTSAEPLDTAWLGLRQKDFPAAKPPGDLPAGNALGALYDLRSLLKQHPTSQENPRAPLRSVDLSWSGQK